MKDHRDELIDGIARCLDRYLLNFEAALCALNGDTIVRPQEDEAFIVDNPLNTPRMRAIASLECTIENQIEEALPEDKRDLLSRLDAAHTESIVAAEDVARLIGFMMGLRLAGLSSDDAKRMARTWNWRSGIHEDQDTTEHDGEESRTH